ncbi:MAG TPA: prolyl oligopeptidase family serine peptidase [Herpetosiphonaceae bacterium]
MVRVESLLSARLFAAPQLVGDRLYFVSNLSGHISLYAMDAGGSVPEPLLPPHIALASPGHGQGVAFQVFPQLGKIVVAIDNDGDENYQPMAIPLEGGFPEPAFGDHFAGQRAHMNSIDVERALIYFTNDVPELGVSRSYRGNLATGEVEERGESKWGNFIFDVSEDHSQVILGDGYTFGDTVLFRWTDAKPERELIYDTPLEQRPEGVEHRINGLFAALLTPGNRGLLLGVSLFADTYGLAYLDFDKPGVAEEVRIVGAAHEGVGELIQVARLRGNRYALEYNIDGASWLYEGEFDEDNRTFRLEHVLVGRGELANGVLGQFEYDKHGDRFALSFSTAISPTQIYSIEGADRATLIRHTRERILGLSQSLLAPGEDASYVSHDGLRVSARLYMPSAELGFQGPRPVIFYIHGGPQSQERPDFAWFSMPLIQYLTLNGFAVFVPNVRGSTGYGISYMKRIDRDWGGQDRLDHVHAMSLLAKDPRLDTSRAGVTGRSYGGFMTLTLATRHPGLWSAAIDMFGPYDLFTFMDRVPETWKPYFALAVGDPVKDRDFLIERSPRTYINDITAPLLVIQGKNDPRVIERESLDVVEQLKAAGKQAEYLGFENEGHDILRLDNRVTCYNAINEFFARYLKP